MSTQCGKLISLMLQEHFGEIVEQVGMYLFKNGSCRLSYIVKYTGLPISKVKLSLCVLIQQGFVTFKPCRNELNAEYKLHYDKVLQILRYPSYLLSIKESFGNAAEIIVEEILIRGFSVASELILKVEKRLEDNHDNEIGLAEIRDKLIALITAKYLMRHPVPTEDKPVPTVTISETEKFLIPDIKINQLMLKRDGKEADVGDSKILWCVNFDRFHQDFRDRLLVSAVTRRFDENAGKLMQVMLQQMYIRTEPWANVSNSISFLEIKNVVKKLPANTHLLAYLDHYLTVMEEDETKFINRCDDADGGQYVINLKSAVTQMCWAVIESIIQQKFHTKAARIFRLVKIKNYIEPDQIQQLAMIPAKEAKRLSYQLLEEGFLTIQELRKASSNLTPNKSFILFHADLDQIVRMTLETSYKCLYNSMTRRHHSKQINKRVIDKKNRVETITMTLKVQGASEEQIIEIEELVTPPEKEMLAKIGKTLKTLHHAELEIDDTLFLLEIFCEYSKKN